MENNEYVTIKYVYFNRFAFFAKESDKINKEFKS